MNSQIPSLIIKTSLQRKTKSGPRFLLKNHGPRAFSSIVERNAGHFLLHSLMAELNVKETIDILASQMRFQFSVYDMLAQLIYARVIAPCSKSKTASSVFPHLYNGVSISEDQVYDGCSFIGASYKKYIVRSSVRPFFWTWTLSHWPCRCIRGTSQRSLISEGSLTK